MPFPEQYPRAFTEAGIGAIPPGQLGCYGLFKQDQWTYVGKGDIRSRLLAHVGGDNACIARAAPTHWVYVLTSDMDGEERRLVRELTPACNQAAG